MHTMYQRAKVMEQNYNTVQQLTSKLTIGITLLFPVNALIPLLHLVNDFKGFFLIIHLVLLYFY